MRLASFIMALFVWNNVWALDFSQYEKAVYYSNYLVNKTKANSLCVEANEKCAQSDIDLIDQFILSFEAFHEDYKSLNKSVQNYISEVASGASATERGIIRSYFDKELILFQNQTMRQALKVLSDELSNLKVEILKNSKTKDFNYTASKEAQEVAKTLSTQFARILYFANKIENKDLFIHFAFLPKKVTNCDHHERYDGFLKFSGSKDWSHYTQFGKSFEKNVFLPLNKATVEYFSNHIGEEPVEVVCHDDKILDDETMLDDLFDIYPPYVDFKYQRIDLVTNSTWGGIPEFLGMDGAVEVPSPWVIVYFLEKEIASFAARKSLYESLEDDEDYDDDDEDLFPDDDE